jgi:hypothetical protein
LLSYNLRRLIFQIRAAHEKAAYRVRLQPNAAASIPPSVSGLSSESSGLLRGWLLESENSWQSKPHPIVGLEKVKLFRASHLTRLCLAGLCLAVCSAVPLAALQVSRSANEPPQIRRAAIKCDPDPNHRPTASQNQKEEDEKNCRIMCRSPATQKINGDKRPRGEFVVDCLKHCMPECGGLGRPRPQCRRCHGSSPGVADTAIRRPCQARHRKRVGT